MIRYLFLDCEMGGRELKYSLLTVALIVMDQKFNSLGTMSLKVKPNDGDYVVSGQGMSINHIDLVEHDQVALPYKVAKTSLYDFLKRMTNDSKVKLTPVGHGVKGDIEHLLLCLISKGSWEQFCTYHYIDTSMVLQFLRACDLMPLDIDGSVGGIAKHLFPNQSLNTIVSGREHEAMFDAMMTAKIYQKMVEIAMKSTS